MTCERSEFVTKDYKYSASVANFGKMSNIFIRWHIRKHIRLCASRVKCDEIGLHIYIKTHTQTC